jgi:hypothetical protein
MSELPMKKTTTAMLPFIFWREAAVVASFVHYAGGFPKFKSLRRAGLLIFICRMRFTNPVSLFTVIRISDRERISNYPCTGFQRTYIYGAKKAATVWDLTFLLGIFIVFILSERMNLRKAQKLYPELEKVSLDVLSKREERVFVQSPYGPAEIWLMVKVLHLCIIIFKHYCIVIHILDGGVPNIQVRRRLQKTHTERIYKVYFCSKLDFIPIKMSDEAAPKGNSRRLQADKWEGIYNNVKRED